MYRHHSLQVIGQHMQVHLCTGKIPGQTLATLLGPGASEIWLISADTPNIAHSRRSVLPQSVTRHADYQPHLANWRERERRTRVVNGSSLQFPQRPLGAELGSSASVISVSFWENRHSELIFQGRESARSRHRRCPAQLLESVINGRRRGNWRSNIRSELFEFGQLGNGFYSAGFTANFRQIRFKSQYFSL